MLVGALLASSSMAWAQEVPNQPPPGQDAPAVQDEPGAAAPVDAGEAGDIVVTALRRNTRIQDTPLAISATSGETLQASGTTSFTELTRTAPSLRIVDSGPGNRRVLIRGITSAGEPTVGVYYDETPVSGSVSTSSDAGGTTPDFRLFDVERAEVLRGPQGTLFGSGSMGGTLRIIYERPNTERIEAAFSGNMTTVKGGDVGASVDAMINLPIIEDKLAIRVVGNYNQFAGYVDNIILTDDPNAAGVIDTSPDPRYLRFDKNTNNGDSYGGRVLVRVTPTERLTVDLGAFYERVYTPSPQWRTEFANTFGRKFVTNSRARAANADKNRIFNLTARYEFDGFTFTGVSSRLVRNRIGISDNGDTFNNRIGKTQSAPGAQYVNVRDSTATRNGCRQYQLGITAATNPTQCTPAQLQTYFDNTVAIQQSGLYQPNSVKNWVHEVRFSSDNDSPFQWTVGGFMEDRDTVVRSTLLLVDPRTGRFPDLATAGSALAYDRTINDNLKQKAAYVELSYKLFDQLTLTAGTRYYDFKKRVGGRIDVGQIHYSSRVTPYQEARSQEDGFIYKFNASWQPSTRLLIYAQAAQGFRPGGVNQVIGLPAERAAYASDSLWNYEVGAKATLAPGVFLNVAGYRIDWDDLQVSARTAGTGSVFGLIANAGAARVWGGEAELSARLMDGLTLSGAFGYTDAKLSEDQISDVVIATGRKGDRIPNVPRYTASLSAEYERPLSDTVNGVLRVDASHMGSFFSTLSPTDVYRRKIPPYELVNTRIGIQEPDGAWGVYLYVNNVLDDTAINSLGASANSGGLTGAFSAPPRTIGINVLKRF